MAKYRLINSIGYVSSYKQGGVYDENEIVGNRFTVKGMVEDYPKDWELVGEPTEEEKRDYIDDYYLKAITNAFRIPPQYFNNPPVKSKSITELLQRIKEKESIVNDEAIPEIVIHADGSGGIKTNKFSDNDKYFIQWFDKSEMNEKLDQLDKKYSTQGNIEWEL